MKQHKTNPFRYAVGMFGTSVPINMFKTYAAAFYVMGLGVTTGQLAKVLLIYTFLDMIDNPVYGFLSDKTHSRWGRRRLWLVIGTPLLILSFIAFFNVPSFIGPNSLFAYMLLTYMLTGTLDSLINANYAALFPELFRTDAERAKTNALRQAFQLVAMVISIALTPIVTEKIGYGKTAVIYGLLAGAVILYMAIGCKEPPLNDDAVKPKLFATLRDMFADLRFWLFGFTNAFYSAALALVMAAIPFYVHYTLGLSGTANTVLLGVVLLLAMGCVAVWAVLVKKFTLMPVWRSALIWLGLAFIPLYFSKNLYGAVAGCILIGMGFAGVITTMDLVGARVMDEDLRRHGIKREGIYASAMGFMNRLSGLFTATGFWLVGTLYGFQSGEVPGDRPGDAARFLLIIFPVVLMAFSVAVSHLLHFPEPAAKAGQDE